MDPRLSPNLTPKPANVVHDVAHPASQPATPHPSASGPAPAPQPAEQAPSATQANSLQQPMVAQLVASFPVKQQETIAPQTPQAAARPVSQHPAQASAGAQPEDDLDKILQAVNNQVKTSEKPAGSRKKELGKKILSKTGKLKTKAKNPKPIGPIIVVLMVALMLSATAIFAYRQGNRTATAANQAGKVGTSYTASSAIQEAGGTLVNPADLDSYAQTLQTKLNSLNDSQDFTINSLSDQVLGL